MLPACICDCHLLKGWGVSPASAGAWCLLAVLASHFADGEIEVHAFRPEEGPGSCPYRALFIFFYPLECHGSRSPPSISPVENQVQAVAQTPHSALGRAGGAVRKSELTQECPGSCFFLTIEMKIGEQRGASRTSRIFLNQMV